MNLPSVRIQREQARHRAIRRAERLDDLADAYTTWFDRVQATTVSAGSADERVQHELVQLLANARKQARLEAADQRVEAERIGDTLAQAARSTVTTSDQV